ncbi:MAG: hypothetical protein R2838_11865 [Caldilineaceae bacterium]
MDYAAMIPDVRTPLPDSTASMSQVYPWDRTNYAVEMGAMPPP